MRDYIAFTNWRVLYINVQGLTGSKREYLTVPYRSVTAFSIETAGTFDLDAEISIYLSGHDPIEFKVGRNTDMQGSADVPRAEARPIDDSMLSYRPFRAMVRVESSRRRTGDQLTR